MAKILSVDDDELVLKVIRRSLMGVHECTGCSAPQQALRLLEQGDRFDVILCDLRLRCATGCDFATTLSLRFAQQASRLVMMSGDGFCMEDCGHHCGHLLLAKPFTRNDILAIIQRAMSQPELQGHRCRRQPELRGPRLDVQSLLSSELEAALRSTTAFGSEACQELGANVSGCLTSLTRSPGTQKAPNSAALCERFHPR